MQRESESEQVQELKWKKYTAANWYGRIIINNHVYTRISSNMEKIIAQIAFYPKPLNNRYQTFFSIIKTIFQNDYEIYTQFRVHRLSHGSLFG